MFQAAIDFTTAGRYISFSKSQRGLWHTGCACQVPLLFRHRIKVRSISCHVCVCYNACLCQLVREETSKELALVMQSNLKTRYKQGNKKGGHKNGHCL